MMKKWTAKSSSEYGDFSTSLHFQIQRKSPSDYFIGRFDGTEKSGLGIQRNTDGSAFFAKYDKGVPLYPTIVVDKNGNLEIDLGEDHTGAIYHLSFNASNSSFVYYKVKNRVPLKNSIVYDGDRNVISFYLNKGTENEKVEEISKRFIPERPIISKNDLVYPEVRDFDYFELSISKYGFYEILLLQ